MSNLNPIKLTIITVCFNADKSIEDTILSVYELAYKNLEYIVIDGGSNDGTANILKKYNDKITYWISEPDNGIYDAMNKGWEKADENSFILYLGAGDKIINLPKLESFNEADVVYGDVKIGDKYTFSSKHNFMLKLGNTIHHQAELIKKSIHITPPFSLKYKIYADFDFNQRLFLMGARFVKDPSFVAYALEGGVSENFEAHEPLMIVRKNFGFAYSIYARLYYLYNSLKINN